MNRRKKGQIWVETVIYTLIELTLRGSVLAIVTPKINANRDKIIVEQSIASLSVLDDKIREVLDNVQGNARKIDEFTLKKGELAFDGETDIITLVLKDISKPYSQPGTIIEVGSVFVFSEVKNSNTVVYLTLNYTNILNLTVSKADVLKKYDPASVPYSFIITKEGGGAGILFVVNIQEISGAGGSGAQLVTPQCTTDANCNDSNSCTNDICNARTCTNSNLEEGVACGGGKICSGGQCITSADPCAPNTNNGEGICTATIIDIIRDGYILDRHLIIPGSGGYSDQNAEDKIGIGLNGQMQEKGYIQWNISSIPSNVQSIEGVSFKGTIKARPYLKIKAMVSPLQAEQEEAFFNNIGPAPTYYSGNDFENGADGDSKTVSLNEYPSIRNDFKAALSQTWFGITLDHTIPPGGGAIGSIYASERGGDYVPTLIVTYTPTTPSSSPPLKKSPSDNP